MKRTRKIAIGLVIYAAIVATIIIFLNQAMALDVELFFLINSISNTYLDSFFLFITYTGSSIFWVIVIIFFWIEKKRKISAYLILAFLVDTVSQFLLKSFFVRPRPYENLPAKVLGFDIELGSSFPSGHTQRAFSGAVILGSFYKRLRIPLLLMAMLVMVSRVYVGVHYPLDTMAGMMNGILIGMSLLNIPYKTIVKKLGSKHQKLVQLFY